MVGASRAQHRDGAARTALGSGPVRTCVGCRKRCRDVELLRVVVADGVAVPDPRRMLPGRGAWVHPTIGCITTAKQRRAFERALKSAPGLDVTPVGEYCSTRRDGRTDIAPCDDVREQGNEVDPS